MNLSERSLRAAGPRPFFAEIPYYLWSDACYDSEGDCRRPTDPEWTWLRIEDRRSDVHVRITCQGADWRVSGTDELVDRVCRFLQTRCSAVVSPDLPAPDLVAAVDHGLGLARAADVRELFVDPRLAPMDSNAFFGSWKYYGTRASEFTWMGRWIMNSLILDDRRGVALCIDWLQNGRPSAEVASRLCRVLKELTGRTCSPADWCAQYPDGPPDLDFHRWRGYQETIWPRG